MAFRCKKEKSEIREEAKAKVRKTVADKDSGKTAPGAMKGEVLHLVAAALAEKAQDLGASVHAALTAQIDR